MHDLISDYFSAQKNFVHLVYQFPKVLNHNAYSTYQNCKLNDILELEKEIYINDKLYRVYQIKNTLFRFLSIEKENQLFELYIII
jgi:hypothetical protein